MLRVYLTEIVYVSFLVTNLLKFNIVFADFLYVLHCIDNEQ